MSEVSLPRFQLFEFHELPWFPAILRRGVTESLRLLAGQTEVQRAVAPLLARTMEQSGCTEILDLCSGSCAPILSVLPALTRGQASLSVTVSDLYPDRHAFDAAVSQGEGRVRALDRPLDARHVPQELRGMRTMFNAFHHFGPNEARLILEDAYRQRVPIAVMEITNRSWARVLNAFPGSLLIACAAGVFSRSPKVVALSFVLPLIPLSFAWDGLVSCLRSYSARELRTLVEGLDEGYSWETGQLETKLRSVKLSYLVGQPVEDVQKHFRQEP
jgi:hypothetical protein